VQNAFLLYLYFCDFKKIHRLYIVLRNILINNMRIRLVSTVMSPFRVVSENFNRQLFDYLLPRPPFAKVRRYEGQQPGDIIDIKLNLPFGRYWTVIIKDSWESAREFGFADRGLRVPFGIKYWQHIHRVVARNESSSFIIDDIEFETSYLLLDFLIYIPIFIAFYPRKYQYGKYFRNLKK
jgi:ligand-binding SRPBCC domain-containing protein